MHYEVLTDAAAAASANSSTSSLLDPSKPTLVSLVPFCVPQANDVPQLSPTSPLHATHNIVAFSPRSHGRTVSDARPSHDPFVSAADLAFAFEALQLPSSHLYAPGTICGRIGVAFAVLFPHLVTALALAGISGREAKTSIEGFKTLDSSMFNPEEPEDLHETLAELCELGEDDPPALACTDRLVCAAAYSLWGAHLTTDGFDAFINLLLRVSRITRSAESTSD
jgi:pimeloyl-ACP methyl ester carboxylesterase